MLSTIKREIRYLLTHKWDLCMVSLAPLCIIILFCSMFYSGKAEHVPIAIINQDHSELSHTIEKYLKLNTTLHVQQISEDQTEVEKNLNQTRIWGYVMIPEGAEQRLVKGEDAQISIVYNQSYFSIGNTISSAMLLSTVQASTDFLKNNYFVNEIPYIDIDTAHIKISPLFNPNLNYELYLEPFVIPAVLHLLLCCCIAFSVGQELKLNTTQQWRDSTTVLQAIFAKSFVYVIIFCFLSWLWMFWLIVIRGWTVAGSLSLILFAQFLFYLAYALISVTVVLATKNLSKTFGFLAVYGGSSLSFAGVTLPLNNAPLFTKFWSNIIPYTPYAKLQTEQWVIGSPPTTSLTPLFILTLYCIFYLAISSTLLKKIIWGAVNEK